MRRLLLVFAVMAIMAAMVVAMVVLEEVTVVVSEGVVAEATLLIDGCFPRPALVNEDLL